MKKNQTTIAAVPGKQEIFITREFEAPRELVDDPGRLPHPALETRRDHTSLDRSGIVALTSGKPSDFNT